MSSRKIVFGVGAGIVSLGVDGLTNILILRLLTRNLPAETAGFWVVVTSAGSLLLLLQCGLGPVIARAVAQARVTEDPVAQQALRGAVSVAFRYIAGGVMLAAVGLYLFYLRPTAVRGQISSVEALAWFPYALGMAANLQGQASLFVLNGYGEVGWDKVFRSIFTAAGFIAVWIALALGCNLRVLGGIYLVQNLLFWIAARGKLASFLGAEGHRRSPQPGQVRGLFREGSKLLYLNLLTFLVTQFTIFVVERYFGLGQVTSYSAMLRVGYLVGAIGSLVPQMLFPYVANSWAAHDLARCRRYYYLGVLSAVSIGLILCLPLYVFGKPLFDLWLGPETGFNSVCFGLVLLFYLNYVHHGAHATPALAVEGNAFTAPATINALLVLGLVFYLPRWWGISGVPAAMVLGTVLPSAYVIWTAWRILTRSKVPAHVESARQG